MQATTFLLILLAVPFAWATVWGIYMWWEGYK